MMDRVVGKPIQRSRPGSARIFWYLAAVAAPSVLVLTALSGVGTFLMFLTIYLAVKGAVAGEAVSEGFLFLMLMTSPGPLGLFALFQLGCVAAMVWEEGLAGLDRQPGIAWRGLAVGSIPLLLVQGSAVWSLVSGGRDKLSLELVVVSGVSILPLLAYILARLINARRRANGAETTVS
ncbi:hypothetical protein [Aureimonas sp. ME7]|uniref:hypothetical protein n=1 Tax=Aureimonas sp. ME7 TaxID=2744252 RepID=UPI0015F40D5E|nr:hypothetical protein [Aureimonas sp. ME7]